jgi:hypothetical protein
MNALSGSVDVVVGVVARLRAERSAVPRNARVNGIGFGAVPVEERRAVAPRRSDAAAPCAGLSACQRSEDNANEGVPREWVTCDRAHDARLRRLTRGVPVLPAGVRRVESLPMQNRSP